MANFEPIAGYNLVPGSLIAPMSEIGGTEAPAEELAVDNTLPVIDTIFDAGRVEEVVIPKYAFVGMQRETGAIGNNTAGVKPILTFAGPQATDPDPIGIAAFNLYREYASRMPGMQSVYARHRYYRFPFVNGTEGTDLLLNGNVVYNSNQNGNLYTGAPITTDTYGRPVLFVPETSVTKAVVMTDPTGTDVTFDLPSGISGTNLPYTVSILNITTPSEVVTRDQNDDVWDAAGSALTVTLVDDDNATPSTGDVVLVTLVYGHKSTKLAGYVGRIRTGVDTNSFAKYLKTNVGTAFPFAPAMLPALTLKATEVFEMNVSQENRLLQLGNQYVDPTRAIKIEFCSAYTGSGDTWINLSNLALTLMYQENTVGSQFSVQPITGTVQLYLDSTECVLTSTSRVRVTYSYRRVTPTNQLGYLGTEGVYGLTDGTHTQGITGMKPAAAVHPAGRGMVASEALAQKSGVIHIALV